MCERNVQARRRTRWTLVSLFLIVNMIIFTTILAISYNSPINVVECKKPELQQKEQLFKTILKRILFGNYLNTKKNTQPTIAGKWNFILPKSPRKNQQQQQQNHQQQIVQNNLIMRLYNLARIIKQYANTNVFNDKSSVLIRHYSLQDLSNIGKLLTNSNHHRDQRHHHVYSSY